MLSPQIHFDNDMFSLLVIFCFLTIIHAVDVESMASASGFVMLPEEDKSIALVAAPEASQEESFLLLLLDWNHNRGK